jgi:polyphosphate glucokinase
MGQIGSMNVFGLDIGGSGIKGAPVDLDRGELIGARQRLDTPAGASIKDVAATVTQLLTSWEIKPDLMGATFPAVIVDGHARTAANVDKAWIGADVAEILGEAAGVTVRPINDADAAGLAEARFGAGKDVAGTVLMLTLGTGIGSAVFLDGKLWPNTEFGHLEVDGHDAETKAADSARDREDLTWEHWAKRLSRYLSHLEALVWPDLIILGGGVSRKSDKFVPLLEGVRTKVVPAKLQNEAGIIGAALWAAEGGTPTTPAGH